MAEQKPWYWWLQQNVFPWQTPPATGQPAGTAEGKWTPFSQTGYPYGFPPQTTSLTPYTQWLMTTPEYAAHEEARKKGGLTELERRRAQEALDATTGGLGKPYQETALERAERELTEAKTGQTIAETGQIGVTPAGEQERIALERETFDWKKFVEESQRRAEEASEARRFQQEKMMQEMLIGWQREQTELQRRPTTYEEYGTSPYDVQETPGVEGQWNPYTGQWEAPSGYIPPYQQETLGLQRQQMAQEEAYRRDMLQWQRESQAQQLAYQREMHQAQLASEKAARLAQLRANPASWLEYAFLAGQTPAIQPWMLPLMPQQYSGLQAGEAIPGYGGGQTSPSPVWAGGAIPSSQAGGEKMGLPELVTPSAQYMSRISPSARQQYYGFETARTGATPEDVQWRQWQQAPPSGMFGGLRRTR